MNVQKCSVTMEAVGSVPRDRPMTNNYEMTWAKFGFELLFINRIQLRSGTCTWVLIVAVPHKIHNFENESHHGKMLLKKEITNKNKMSKLSFP